MASRNLGLVAHEGEDGARFHLPGHPQWDFIVRVHREGGSWRVASLVVLPADAQDWTDTPRVPRDGITQGTVRAIPFKDVGQAMGTTRTRDGRRYVDVFLGDGAAAELRRNPHPGGSGRDHAFYARWAHDYLQASAVSRSPIKEVAKRHHYAVTTMRDFIAEARRRKLLTRPPRGRAGGELTPKGRRIVERLLAEDAGS